MSIYVATYAFFSAKKKPDFSFFSCIGPLAAHVLQVCYSLAVIAMFAYVAYSHFRIDGPLWEAFAWTAGEAPFFIIPLWFVPCLRNIFIRTYAAEGPSDSTGSDDLSSNLLGPENV